MIDESYLNRMSKPGQRGDGNVLSYACKLYNREITVLKTDGSNVSFKDDQQQSSLAESSSAPLLMGYVRTSGSATEKHYVYLRKVSYFNNHTP